MKIRTVIVDDNIDAINTFKQICVDFFPQITIVEEFTKAKEAFDFIKKNTIDWLVLDIDLQSEINGFDLLSLIGLERNFEVIFYSGASNQYQEAIRVHAFDFLDKPFSITELKNTVNRYLSLKNNQILIDKTKLENFSKLENEDLIKFNTQKQTVFVKASDLVYLEAIGAYTNIYYTDNQTIKVSRNLSFLSNKIDNLNLIKISRSLLINKNQIESIQKDVSQNSIIRFKDGTNKIISNSIRKKMFDLLHKQN